MPLSMKTMAEPMEPTMNMVSRMRATSTRSRDINSLWYLIGAAANRASLIQYKMSLKGR
jgi:hypothetical protein